MTPRQPIFLLTDFGLDDWYVGAMKGEILRRAPDAKIVDLCHGIAPRDVAAGAFVLRAAIPSIPRESVLCCVVDPGVGTERRAICGRIGDYFFSGPDNGLATPLLELVRSSSFSLPDVDLHEISSPQFLLDSNSALRTPQSAFPGSTFHGRDLFAPAAVLLASGIPPNEAGPPAADPIRLNLDPEERTGGIRGRVMIVDRFGNLITNIRRDKYESRLGNRFEIQAGPLRLTEISKTFGAVAPGAPLAYWGSAGTLEIGVNMGSAAHESGLGPASSVHCSF